ncbi:MAG: adenylate/guanylate cyclase domain-containing protein [bacterium]
MSTSNSNDGMRAAKGHVLVVDDDSLNRLQLLQGLKQQGYSTAQAEDGARALEVLDEESFDLVILDILMPNLDGFEVLRRMKNDGALRDIPIIVISALDEMDSVVRCIRMGAEDHLSKPFDPTLLEARVGACLEKKQMRETIVRTLGKYVPESVAASIIRDEGTLEPARTLATVLFSDIENFTSIAESMPPERVFQMLNEYFPAVVKPIIDHGGVVNQFQGDAMLVTFNVPVKDPIHADNAVKTAAAIQAVVAEKDFAGITLRTRIGINTGEVIAGNVGAGSRYNYTVHGDAVNSAARLEQLNKEYDTNSIISESTKALLRNEYPIEAIGEVPIRGKRESLRIFRLDP